jgi:divalent metal cation (Fe/Co/Zn/Cd) transporter
MRNEAFATILVVAFVFICGLVLILNALTKEVRENTIRIRERDPVPVVQPAIYRERLFKPDNVPN